MAGLDAPCNRDTLDPLWAVLVSVARLIDGPDMTSFPRSRAFEGCGTRGNNGRLMRVKQPLFVMS